MPEAKSATEIVVMDNYLPNVQRAVIEGYLAIHFTNLDGFDLTNLQPVESSLPSGMDDLLRAQTEAPFVFNPSVHLHHFP